MTADLITRQRKTPYNTGFASGGLTCKLGAPAANKGVGYMAALRIYPHRPGRYRKFSLMKQLITLLLCGFLAKSSPSQSNKLWQVFGKYEGIEIKYLKHVSDTSAKVDRMNETWGKKTLT